MIDNEAAKKAITKYLRNKIDCAYFGKVIIVFMDGKVVHIVEEKSLMIDNVNN